MTKRKAETPGKLREKNAELIGTPSGNSATRTTSESAPGQTSFGGDVPVAVEPQERREHFDLRGFLGASGDDVGAPEVPPKRGRGRPPKNPPQTIKLAPRELVEVLLVPAMIFASRLRVPDEAKPLREEVESFLLPLCSIVLRHTPPIAASADALDVVRMFFAGMHYYQRIAPLLEAQKETTPRPEAESEGIPYDQAESASGGNGRPRLHPELAPTRVGLYTGSA